MTVIVDPEQIWLGQAFAVLEEAIEQPLDLWTRSSKGEWSLIVPSDAGDAQRRATQPSDEQHRVLDKLLDQAMFAHRPCSAPLTARRHFLAVPLIRSSGRTTHVAVTTIETDNIEFLVGIATVGQRFYQQQEQIVRLKEENDYFLKQISDDFEELTFLRAMAERLNLGDGTHDVDQLIRDSIPRLGDAVHAEGLYFIKAPASGESQLIAKWHADGSDESQFDELTIKHLVEEYRDAATEQPIINNRFTDCPEGKAFPGVHEFMLVAVASSLGPLGWYLALNRYFGRAESQRNVPQWRLSQNEFGSSEASLLSTAGAMLASHANNLALFREREELLVKVVRTLVSAIEAKDQYTCGHSERVALYGRRLAEQMGYDEKACQRLYLTGLLHDVGKIAVSDAVLNKPGRLTDEEFAEIKRHPDEGWRILQELKQLNYVLPGVLHHHERTDGNGYPDGLAGKEIPLDGRILAVADAYDAMTSDRAYRQGMTQEQAEAILREGTGTQWDAEVIDAFFSIAPEIVALRERYCPRTRPERQKQTTASAV